MVYKITFDSFTKINEQAGTIQNVGDYIIEMSESPTFDSGILILPNQKSTFNNTDIYLRCTEQGFSSEVRVVPFILDAKGGDDSYVDTTALKSVTLDGNTLNFYTSSDTAQTAAFSIDIPAEQFIDQAATSFVPNFYFSAILYPDAVNPNLNGKPVFVLGVKSKSNDGQSSSTKYSFIDVSKLVDTYVASDTSVTVSDYKFKVNISPDAKNALKLKANGLYADGVTDTATSSALGLTKLYSSTGTSTDGTLTQAAIKTELAGKLDSDATAQAAFKDSAGNVISDTYATKTALSTGLNSKLDSDATAAKAFKDSAGNVISDTYVTKTALSTGLNSKLDSDATAQAAFKDSSGNVITDTYVTKTELNHKLGAVRYGYRISKTESDPYARVEYLYDAVGMRPAHMVWDTDTTTAGTDSDTSYFDYGDWQSVWFVRDNKPLMLNPDGSVAYYLNPNDYSKKVDGSSSNISDTDTALNTMTQFPLAWIYRYEDDNYLYEIVSNVQWDENYKAYAHTDRDGNIKDYFYYSTFVTSMFDSKLRSLSGQNPKVYITFQNSAIAASANGAGWDMGTWVHKSFITTLMILVSKSCDALSSFGRGKEHTTGILTTTGLTNTWGQFFGYKADHSRKMKVFHVEDFIGTCWKHAHGIGQYGGKVYAKMTPENGGYHPRGLAAGVAGFTNTGINAVNGSGNYIKSMRCTPFGFIVSAVGGSSSTYYCSTYWCGVGYFSFNTAVTGGVTHSNATNTIHTSGAFTFFASNPDNYESGGTGDVLTYV